MFLRPQNLASGATAAIFLDFDDVLHNPNRSDPAFKHSYVVENDGSLFGSLINKDLFKNMIQYAIKNAVPMYVVTARPDSHKQYIVDKIKEVDGFSDEIGGFKEKNIFCLGKAEFSKELNRPHVVGLIKIKLEQIKEIHQKELAHLHNSHVLFCDDEIRNLEPVAKADYATFLARGSANEDHFYFILSYLKSIIEQKNVAVFR